MPPRRWSRRVWRTLAGPSWPGTSMSVATSSTSWRSTRVPRRRSSSSRSAGVPAATSACPRRRSTIASGSRVRAARPYGLLDRGTLPGRRARARAAAALRPRRRRARRTGSGTIGMRCDDRGGLDSGSTRDGRPTDREPTRATLPPGPGHDPEPTRQIQRPRHQAWSTHADRSDRDGAGRATEADRSPATRSAEESNRQEVAHRAVRFDAPAARGRSPLRPPDPPLEPEDEAVHLRRAQRDPHHRPGPDRPAPRRRPRVRPRDRRPRRPGPVRRAPRSRPRSRSPRRRPAPTSRTSTSAGSAACSPTS